MLRKGYDFIVANRLLVVIFVAGITLRLIFFIRAYKVLPVSTDEALPGLMAKHILDGEFPVVYWGQSYMGTLESFFQSIFIYFFKTIPFSVRIYPLLAGLLFTFITFKLADEIYNRHIALISLSLVSIPTAYLSICSSIVPPDNYLAIVLIGSLALLLLHRVIYRPIDEKQKMRYHLLMGFLSGIGFWIHLLYINYIVLILLFFFIQDKLFFLRKRFWVFALFFIIGSLPFIHYNITHNFDTFTVAKGVGLRKAFENLLMLFRDVIPQLLGIKIPLYGDNWNTLPLPKYWGFMLGLVYGLAFLYIIISRCKKLLGFLTLSLKRIGPTEMLLAFVVICIVIFIRSGRANSWAVRYILPVFSVVPILLSLAIYNIGRRYKAVAVVMLGIVMIIQLYGNGRLYEAWGMPDIVENALDLPDDRLLIAFLDSKGISRAYAHYWIADRLTYETGERIICARPYDERFGGRYKPRYIDEVNRTRNVAFIFHPTLGLPYKVFEENVKGIGGGYKKETVGPYTIFYDFISPIGEPIQRAGWIAESNYSPGDVTMAFDNDISTRWATRSPQKPGAYFLIDLGESRSVSGISMFLGRFKTDYPRGVIVQTSGDRIVWKTAMELQTNLGNLVWENGHPVFNMENSRTELYFKPVKARYIKITQTGRAYPFDWSIAELYVYRTTND